MPPKRKAAQKASNAWAQDKRRRDVEETPADDAPLTRKDLASLVESITERVTQQVTAALIQTRGAPGRATEEGNVQQGTGKGPHLS